MQLVDTHPLFQRASGSLIPRLTYVNIRPGNKTPLVEAKFYHRYLVQFQTEVATPHLMSYEICTDVEVYRCSYRRSIRVTPACRLVDPWQSWASWPAGC